MRHDAEEAALLLPFSGECLVLRAVEEGDAAGLEALRARLVALKQAARGSHLCVAALGGGAAVRRTLKEAGSLWGTSPLTLFQVTADGRLWRDRLFGSGASVVGPVLKQALQRIAAAGAAPLLAPAEREALRRELAAPSAEAAEHAAFWTALGRRTPWASWAIGLFAAAVFALESVWGGSTFSPTLYRMGANVRERVLAGEVFRLFSAAFLHIGVAHVVINLWALRVVGPFLEKVLGTARFLILYALSALVGSLASVAVGRASLSAGASGALWGLMVGGFALALWPRGLLPESVRRAAQTRGWQPLAVNFLYSFTPGIDLFAHFGGGLAGGLLVATGAVTRGALRPHGVRRPDATVEPAHAGRPSRAGLLVTALAAGLSVLMVASVPAALVTGRPWELRTPPPSRPLALPGTPFVVDAPAGMSLTTRLDDDDPPAHVFALGHRLKDPFVATIRIVPMPAAAAADPRAVAEALRQALEQERLPAGVSRAEAPQVVDLQGGPSAVSRLRFASGVAIRMLMLRAGWRLDLTVTCPAAAAPAWRSAADALGRSVRAAGPNG